MNTKLGTSSSCSSQKVVSTSIDLPHSYLQPTCQTLLVRALLSFLTARSTIFLAAAERFQRRLPHWRGMLKQNSSVVIFVDCLNQVMICTMLAFLQEQMRVVAHCVTVLKVTVQAGRERHAVFTSFCSVSPLKSKCQTQRPQRLSGSVNVPVQ